jgi:hypothetical protein
MPRAQPSAAIPSHEHEASRSNEPGLPQETSLVDTGLIDSLVKRRP